MTETRKSGSRAQEVIAEERTHIKSARAALSADTNHHSDSCEDLKALCLSGGGIRSASFSIGVLQAFAEKGLMYKFDYLSAVSGGGYALGWWSAIVRRHLEDCTCNPATVAIDGVKKAERDIASYFGDKDEIEPGLRDAFVRRYVRAHGNYLTVRTGLLSADTWAAFLTLIRNLLYGLAGLGLLFVVAARGIVLALDNLRESMHSGPEWLAIVSGFFGIAGWGMTNFAITKNLEHQETFRSPTLIASLLTGCAFFLAALLCIPDCYLLTSTNSAQPRRVALYVIALVTLLDIRLLLAIAGKLKRDGSNKSVLAVAREVLGRFFILILFTALGIMIVALKMQWVPVCPQLKEFVDGVQAFFNGVPTRPWLLWELFVLANAWELARGWMFVGGQQATSKTDDRRRNRLSVIAGNALLVGAVGVLIWAAPSLTRLLADSTGSSIPWIQVAILAVGLVLAAITMSALVTVAQGTQSTDSTPEHREWWASSGSSFMLCALFAAGILTISQMAMLVDPDKAAGLIVPVAIGSLVCVAFATHNATHHAVRLFFRGLGLVAAVLMIFVTFLAAVLLKEIDESMSLGPFEKFPIATVGGLIVAVVVLLRSGPNTFSMHELYRNRLVRAFLGASKRQPTKLIPFIDFSSEDDLLLFDLGVRRSERSGGMVLRPFPIWCATVNVTDSSEIGLQERKAVSFVFTPLHCGYEITSADRRTDSDKAAGGYAPSKDHGTDYNLTDKSYEPEPLTVGTVVATSGAAFSSNAGASTKPERALLLTLLGLRLGRWFPNPGKYRSQDQVTKPTQPSCPWTAGIPVHVPGGKDRHVERLRAFAWPLILREAFSQCDINTDSVYVTDGGHFENLGVYEMIRRRAMLIVAFDAGCDPRFEFEDLLNLQTKVRTDFGVEIRIEDLDGFRLSGSDYAKSQVAVWQIDYPSEGSGRPGARGTLIYSKCTLTGNEPKDLLNYRKVVPSFPHISTLNQWFAESAFEAYRTLGLHIGRQAASVFEAFISDLNLRERE